LTRIQSTFNVNFNHYKAVVAADVVTFVVTFVVVVAAAVVVENFILLQLLVLKFAKIHIDLKVIYRGFSLL